MKAFKIIFSLFLIGSIFFGSTAFRSTNTIQGLWVFEKYEDEHRYWKKAKRFAKDKPGLKFLANGKLIKRQNVGWCGTPPITYGNYKGTWEWTSDSVIHVTYDYWGGKAERNWRVVKLSDHSLVIKSD